MPSRSAGEGRGGNAASNPPTANASSNGERRAAGRGGIRAVFHGLSRRTEGMPPTSRGAEVGAEDGVAQGFTIVPLEALENVLALTASVVRGSSNRDSVGEAEITEGDALRGDELLQSWSSSRPLPRPPALRARASRGV